MIRGACAITLVEGCLVCYFVFDCLTGCLECGFFGFVVYCWIPYCLRVGVGGCECLWFCTWCLGLVVGLLWGWLVLTVYWLVCFWDLFVF